MFSKAACAGLSGRLREQVTGNLRRTEVRFDAPEQAESGFDKAGDSLPPPGFFGGPAPDCRVRVAQRDPEIVRPQVAEPGQGPEGHDPGAGVPRTEAGPHGGLVTAVARQDHHLRGRICVHWLKSGPPGPTERCRHTRRRRPCRTW